MKMGVAFYSGTVESFGYESAIRENKEYSEVLVISGILSNFAYLLSLVVGGYLYLLNQNLPNTQPEKKKKMKGPDFDFEVLATKKIT